MFTDLSETQTLQALLLSLSGLDTISSDEKEKLKKISTRLVTTYSWKEEVQPKLLEIINNNQFQKSFTEAKEQLNLMSEEEISSLFPTDTDLEKVIPSESRFSDKVAPPKHPPDRDGDHLHNIVIEVLAAEYPEKTASELFQERQKNQQKNKTQNHNSCE